LLRFEHSIPLNIVIDRLLLVYDRPRSIKKVLERVEARLLTVDEDKDLNRLYRDKMPEGWDWKTGAADERYKAAGIKFPDGAATSASFSKR
jgi:hypothetical protein